ncbi:MAG: urease [Rhodobacteraceae bacterium]|nr:urease [Paracoccaceae bacterium]MAY45486.1 urease [Paracoccaceae bacterium]|tara:strand:- start:739 stop:1101 length:363 start_codon:yes stop_codon:yes gene_type:complete
MRLLPSLASLVLLALPVTAQAACPGDTQIELNECAAADYKTADAELNAVWKRAKAYYDRIGHGGDLLDAQRKWLAFRDATCQVEIMPYDGGSIQPLIYSSCLTRTTRHRTEDLTQMLPEG